MSTFNPEAVRDIMYELNYASRADAVEMDKLHADGEWISSEMLTPEQCAEMREADGERWYVNADGYGWAWYPSGREMPENVHAEIRRHAAERSPVPWRDHVRPLDPA